MTGSFQWQEQVWQEEFRLEARQTPVQAGLGHTLPACSPLRNQLHPLVNLEEREAQGQEQR